MDYLGYVVSDCRKGGARFLLFRFWMMVLLLHFSRVTSSPHLHRLVIYIYIYVYTRQKLILVLKFGLQIYTGARTSLVRPHEPLFTNTYIKHPQMYMNLPLTHTYYIMRIHITRRLCPFHIYIQKNNFNLFTFKFL